MVLDEEEEGVIMTLHTRKGILLSWYYPSNWLARVGFTFLSIRMGDGIFYAHLNAIWLGISQLVFCTHNTSLCSVPIYRFWNGQIAPHPLAVFGFALGCPPTSIYALPPLHIHIPPFYISQIAIPTIHDFLNRPVVSLQPFLDRLLSQNNLGYPYTE